MAAEATARSSFLTKPASFFLKAGLVPPTEKHLQSCMQLWGEKICAKLMRAETCVEFTKIVTSTIKKIFGEKQEHWQKFAQWLNDINPEKKRLGELQKGLLKRISKCKKSKATKLRYLGRLLETNVETEEVAQMRKLLGIPPDITSPEDVQARFETEFDEETLRGLLNLTEEGSKLTALIKEIIAFVEENSTVIKELEAIQAKLKELPDKPDDPDPMHSTKTPHCTTPARNGHAFEVQTHKRISAFDSDCTTTLFNVIVKFPGMCGPAKGTKYEIDLLGLHTSEEGVLTVTFIGEVKLNGADIYRDVPKINTLLKTILESDAPFSLVTNDGETTTVTRDAFSAFENTGTLEGQPVVYVTASLSSDLLNMSAAINTYWRQEVCKDECRAEASMFTEWAKSAQQILTMMNNGQLLLMQ